MEPGKRLQNARTNLGYGVKTVYKETGVGDSTIRRIESGNCNDPSAKHLHALADFYNMDVIQLYKDYGYLNEDDTSCYCKIFKNAELLTDDEIKVVQDMIDILTKTRKTI